MSPAEGWYRDPADTDVERWWTGRAWDLATSRRANRFSADFPQLVPQPTPPERDPLPLTRVTTLQGLPGHRVVQVLGVVTELSAASGFTAGTKGNHALDTAMDALRVSAVERGANAVLALSATTFGARGGVTSAFGGDAVGVLLMGTAVVVEPLDDSADPMAQG